MTFVKGKSGNPAGKRKLSTDEAFQHAQLKVACRELTPEILENLTRIMRQQEDLGSSVKAMTILLERGYGKATEFIELTGKDGAELIPTLELHVRSANKV